MITQVKNLQQEFAALPLSQFLVNLLPAQAANFNVLPAEGQLRLWQRDTVGCSVVI